MCVSTHPPVKSHSFANEEGIVDDVVVGQGGALWGPSCTLVIDIGHQLRNLLKHH